MAESPKRKILDLYFAEEITLHLRQVVQGWLADSIDNTDVDAGLSEHFNRTVVKRSPRIQTYRRLQALQMRLGISKKEAITIPLAGRTGFRVAAVLLPMIIVSGVALNMLNNGQESVKVPQVAVIQQDTISDSSEEEIIPVEIVPVPEPTPPTENKTKPQTNPALTTEPAPVVYDFEVTTSGNIHKYVKLADNSTVILNDGGTLKFCSERREAFLTGEAYFEVAKGQELPFKVVTDRLTVNVTGTRFNITAPYGEAETIVHLVTGNVNIDTEAGNIELKPQEQFTLDNRSGLIKIGKASEDCWWDQPLEFDGLTICEILGRLEHCFGINIYGKEKMENQVQYTIKFSKTSSLDHILSVLQEVCPAAEYKEEGSAIIVHMTNDSDNS